MSIFKKQPLIIYLKRNTILLYPTVEGSAIKVDFFLDEVANLEILNAKKLSDRLNTLIKEQKLKPSSFIILLAEEIIFQKLLPKQEQAVEGAMVADFLSEVPIDPKSLQSKIINTDDGRTVFAVNKDLYELIIKVLTGLGWKNGLVYPLILFYKDPKKETLTSEEIKQIVRYNKLTKAKSFLTNTTMDTQNTTKSPLVKIIIAGALVILIAGLAFFAYTKYSAKKEPVKVVIPQEETPTLPEASPSETPESSESKTTEQTLDKKTIKVSVLNGSGITGLAAKTKTKIETLGYEAVVTGNYEGDQVDETTITFAPKIPQALRDELTSLLKKDFATVTATEDASLKNVDIKIILGKKLTGQ